MKNFDRRTFLKNSLLGITTATLSSSFLPRLVLADDDPNESRPFEMLVLGDSIVWGQGLLKEQKFFYLIKDWLQSEVFKNERTFNEPHVEAHSGATIFPEFNPEMDFTKKYSSGETNVSNPSILFQAINAFNHYKSAGQTSDGKAVAAPDQVDLIILDGGINDFSPLMMLHTKKRDEEIKANARDFCGNGMQLVLGLLASSFPNARIVVTGYYQLVSEKTDPKIFAKTLSSLLRKKKFSRFFNIPFYKDERLVKELARRCELWRRESDFYLKEAVQIANKNSPMKETGEESDASNSRVIFVPAPFDENNAYATGESSYLWQLTDDFATADPLFDEREKTCKVDGKKGFEYAICLRAAIFHPNRQGAKAYAEAIKRSLIPIVSSAGWENKNLIRLTSKNYFD